MSEQGAAQPVGEGGAAAGGRGRGRGGRGRGRGNRGRNRSGRGDGGGNKSEVSGFKGNTDGMKGHVFQCHGENTDKQQFTKTVGVLEEYINKTLTYPQDVATICTDFELATIKQPERPTEKEYKEDMFVRLNYDGKMKKFMKREDQLESNVRAIYAVIWGQCSTMMQAKLESLDDYKEKRLECDCVWLLKEIRGITHRFEGTRNVFISLDDAWSRYYTSRQGQQQSLHEWRKTFQSLVEVLEHYGAAFGAEAPYQEALRKKISSDSSPDLTPEELTKKVTSAAKKKSIAIGFLKRADRKRYGGLWSSLENDYTLGVD